MEPTTDLRAELAPLFGDEPPQRPLGDLLEGGRRRLRRRRAVQALAGAAVAVVVGSSFAVAISGPRADTGYVDQPGSSQPPEPTATTTYDQANHEGDEDRIRGFHVDRETGEVTEVAGGEVRDSIILGEIAGGSGAVAVDVVLDGDETWWYVDWSKTGGSGSTNVAAQPEQPFSEWAERMHQQQSNGEAPPPPPELVVIDQYGQYTLSPGVEVLDQVDNPLGLAAPYSSVALDVRKGDRREMGVFWPSGATFGTPGEETLQDVIEQALGQGPSYTAAGPMPPLWDWGPDRMPVLMPGVEVVQRVDNPLGVERPRRSVAWVLRFDSKTWWALWELGPSTYNGAQTIRVAGDGYASFEKWLADQTVQTEW